MNHFLFALAGFNYLHLLWLFFVVIVLHELEEWNIDRFERRNFTGLPPAATDRSARFCIAFVILSGLVWVSAATLPGSPTTAAWIFLPAMAIMVQNGLQHVFWSFYFREYAPGVITSVALVIPAGLYLMAQADLQGYVPAWYVAIWAGFIVAGTIQTLLAGKKMTPPVRGVNSIGVILAERIRIGG